MRVSMARFASRALCSTGVLLAAVPAAVVLPPLVGLAGLVLILAALIIVETTRYAQIRRSLRGPESSAAVDAKEKHQPASKARTSSSRGSGARPALGHRRAPCGQAECCASHDWGPGHRSSAE
jgi:hypothetical protein